MAKKAAGKTPEVLEAEAPEVGLVQTDGSAVVAFLNGLVPFFRTAAALEHKAHGTLAAAKRIAPPKTKEEDAEVQTFIRTATADKKQIEAHWSITTVFHGLHRKLTAARARGIEPLESAAALAQRLHNDYAEAERRRVAAENERLRLANERAAREERERELEALEAEALKAEQANANLSEREEAFVDLVSRAGLRPTEAASRVGFKSPASAGERLMNTGKIIAALDAKKQAQAIREQAAAVREQPLEVRTEVVTAEISKAGGHDRTTWSAELLDERLLIEAILGGKHGIPTDLLRIHTPTLNDYAVSLHELIDRWPGVRSKKTTKTV